MAATHGVSDFEIFVTEATSWTYAFNNSATGTNHALAILPTLENNGANGISVSSVTYNGASLTKLGHAAPTTWSRAELWYLAAPATGSHNAVVTLNSADRGIMCLTVASNVDQTTVMRAAATSAATTGTSTTDTPGSVESGDLVIDALSIDGVSHSPVVGADQTQRVSQIANPYTSGAVSTQLGSVSPAAMSWTWTTSAPNAHIASAFIDVAAAGRTTKNTRAWPLGVEIGMHWRVEV